MSSAKDHYDNHLAEFYSWMAGDFTAKVKENEEFFKVNNILPFNNKIALDLGSGHGFQSCALSSLGFNVTAVDFSKKLLDEVKQNSTDKVETIEADITDFKAYSPLEPELIVCMGDTLTHLNSLNDIENLISNSAKLLTEKGKIVFSFRNYMNELTGNSRFIPVKSDDNRILTCFLEYETEYVIVNDILYEKENNNWNMKTSFYRKLRLSPDFIVNNLIKNNFNISHTENKNGMEFITAQRH